MNNPYSGTLRTDYDTDRSRPDSFPAMESDGYRLLHRLIRASDSIAYRDDDGSEGTLTPLLANHVLTVLTDIIRKQLSGYGETFADAQGTIGETAFAKKLRRDIEGWIIRLKAYIDESWKMAQTKAPAVAVATLLSDELKKSLPNVSKTENNDYYRMLRTVKSIQEHATHYLTQIETSGDVDGSLSLLIVYLKNYCNLVQSFNTRLAELPALYRNEILHVKPGAVVQDNAYIVFRPTQKCTLKTGQPFRAGQNAAGDELIYRTTKDEFLSPMQCAGVDAVYCIKNNSGKTIGIRRQSINIEDATAATTLFDPKQGETLAFGWQMESSMFVLNEGEREVSLFLNIQRQTTNALPSEWQGIEGFTCYLSSEKGWAKQHSECYVSDNRLCFRFTIGLDGTLPTACTEETHRKSTKYPLLRILTNETACPYDWASKIEISEVEIQTHVKGIRNFTFYNELGKVDTAQPFQPFGIQALRGAWFLFGNLEMGLKHLTEVRMKGIWQKMPETKREFDDRYRAYGVDAASFKISTQWQEKGKWHTCHGEPQSLFQFDEEGKLSPVEVCFNFIEQKNMAMLSNSRYEYSPDKDGFFRVALQTPAIGFGADEYRKQFTDIMIHNSRCKEKNRKELPQEPLIPMLTDVELEYVAMEKMSIVPKSELIEIHNNDATCFKSQLTNEEDKSVYFSFINVTDEQTLRMYLDMALPKEKIPFRISEPIGTTYLIWEYLKENIWTELPPKSVMCEESRGLTQSGFIEIKLPKQSADLDKKVWLRASVKGDSENCLAISGLWTNYIRLTAQNGDGQPLPAKTIQEMPEANERIEQIVQPLPGFGGRSAGTEEKLSSHLTARISNRHRAVTAKDYEQIVLEHFPEVDKAVCITLPDKGKAEVCLIVFSRLEDGRYYLSPSWKLAEIERTMRYYTSAFVRLKVMNPKYQEVKVFCKAVLHKKVQDNGKVVRDLTSLAQNYLAPWIKRCEIPNLQPCFSYKELHSRIANHEDVQTMVTLTVDGKGLPEVGFDSVDIAIKGTHPWSVLIPTIEIILLSLTGGIGNAEIGGNFIIK